MFPNFKEHSFIELTPIELFMNDFSIEAEFKSNKQNGILFYSSQITDGSGDFISIIIRNGLVEMRYLLLSNIFCCKYLNKRKFELKNIYYYLKRPKRRPLNEYFEDNQEEVASKYLFKQYKKKQIFI